MAEISITELRRNLPTWVDQVIAGEQIRITRRGKVVALLEPVRDRRAAARDRLQQLRLVARVGDAESPVDLGWEADGSADPA
jgi:prevent-host-death family protein